MATLDPAAIERGLSVLVGDPVTIAGAASLGAQRHTLFVDIDRPRGRSAAVAQISTSVVAASPVSREADVIRLAAAHGLPVPTVIAWTDELDGIGAPAMVTSVVDGLTIPRQVLRSLDQSAGEALAAECGAVLARLHQAPVEGLTSPLDRFEASTYCDSLERLMHELDQPRPAVQLALNWLRRHAPDRARVALIHGDFRNGNLVVDTNGLAGVLDWELCQLSDPMADPAWLCLRTWRFGNDDRLVGGFGSLEALRDGYETAGGKWDETAFLWWSIARSAMWALGLASQSAAFERGHSDSIVLAASGRRVPELEYDTLMLIKAATSR